MKKKTHQKKHNQTKHAHAKHAHKKKKDKSGPGQYLFGAAVFLVLVAIVIALILLSSKSGMTRLGMQSSVAATVNGEEVTTAYLNEQYDRVPQEYRAVVSKETLLNQTINEMLLLQEAKSKGIEVSSEDVHAEIEKAMSDSGVTKAQLKERLEAQNITVEFLEELYQKQLTINKLLEEVVFVNIAVSEAEVAEFYNSRIHAKHILVEDEDTANAIIAELDQVSYGQLESEFESIAKEKSIDPSAAQNGGDLGEFGRGQMVPPFEKAAFELEENEYSSDPVQSQFGYHVILRLPMAQSLEEQREQISEFIMTQKKAQAVPLYVQQLMNKAEVEITYQEEAEE